MYRLIIILNCLILLVSIRADALKTNEQIPVIDHYTILENQWNRQCFWSLSDVLELSPGIWHRNPGMISGWQNIRFRGTEFHHTKFLLDGIPLYDPWTHTPDIEWIPLGLLKSIEIYPGMNPYGESAIGSVINFKSRSFESKKPLSRFVYRTHMFPPNDTLKYTLLNVYYSQWIFHNLHILSGITVHQFSPDFPSERLDADHVNARIAYQPFRKLGLTYQILSNKSENDYPYAITLPGDTSLLSAPRRHSQRLSHALQASYTSDYGMHQINGIRVNHRIRMRNYADNSNAALSDHTVTQQGVITSHTFHLHSWTLRGGYKYFQYQLKADSESVWKKLHESNTFVQAVCRPSSGFKAQAQIQYLMNNRSDNMALYSVTAHVNAANLCRLSLGFHQSARMPSMTRTFGIFYQPYPPDAWTTLYAQHNPRSWQDNDTLKPEKSNMITIGIEPVLNRDFQFNCNLYHQTIDHVILHNIRDTVSVFQNSDKYRMYGLESEAVVQLPARFQVSAVVNLMNAVDKDDNTLFERPTLWGQSAVSWGGDFFKDNLNAWITLSLHYFSDYFHAWYDLYNPADLTYYTIPGNLLMHIKGAFYFMHRMQLSLTYQNLLNNRFQMVRLLTIPQSLFRMGINWDLYN